MKRVFILFVGIMLWGYGFSRERIPLNEGWLFKLALPLEEDDPMSYPNIKLWMLPTGNDFVVSGQKFIRPTERLQGSEYVQVHYDDSEWRRLDLPHDWGIEGDFHQDYPGGTGKRAWWGTGFYRKYLDIPELDRGKQFYLEIDGSMSITSVWCNGEFAGGWVYGYTSFRVDLTPYIKVGERNTIAIQVDNQPESSRWYPGGGIYRNVWIVKTAPIAVSQWGTFITTPQVSKDAAHIRMKVCINSSKESGLPIKVKTDIFALGRKGKRGNKPLLSDTTEVTTLEKENFVEHAFKLKCPQLWSVDSPMLYLAVTSIIENRKVIDSYETTFGIRNIEFKSDSGFYLNGERMLLQGVCMHHDLGALGAAINVRAMERQLEMLKEMGVNAIRTSHNPPAPELLDLCDRMGFVVVDEFADTWSVPKMRNDYGKFFNDWHEQDLRSLIRRDRNHPCVIMWSIGNEVAEQGMGEKGIQLSAMLRSIAHQEDETRPTTLGCNDGNAGFNGLEKSTDVFGFNYKPYLYGRFAKANPGLPFYGSETASCISSRGVYQFPLSDDKSEGRVDFQVSSYDLYAPGWAMKPDEEFKGQDMNPASAGEFAWTGFDYLGEPTPYNKDKTILMNFHDRDKNAQANNDLQKMEQIKIPSRSSYFGIIDLAGFKKDRFYLYQSRWRSELPMAHILPHWNWKDRIGKVTPVHVYTSGDSAELFLNGKSLGRKEKKQYEYRLRWDSVIYQPGELKVITYRNGKRWAKDVVKTSGKATEITLAADHKSMKADGVDLIFVTISIRDKEGLFVPTADNRVYLEVAGPAEIIATDNGNPVSHEAFQKPDIKVFNGLGLAILRSLNGENGTITLKAVSDGLKAETITLKSGITLGNNDE